MLTLIGPSQARFACAASMPRSTSATGKSTSFMLPEDRVIQAVQAHRHALQAGGFQRLGLALPAASRWW